MPPTHTALEARATMSAAASSAGVLSREASGQAPLLSVRDLRTYFALEEGTVKAVDGISFDVHPGEVVGIVGESGCGKSITMKSVIRTVQPPGKVVGGEILFRPRASAAGELDEEGYLDIAKLEPAGRRIRQIRGGEIALIPQEPMAAFSPLHTIGNQIIEAITLHQHLSRRQARQIAIERLHEVGVPSPEQRVDAYSWQLSGGLRQRAIIAMALACNPRLLIADEPTTAVDVTTQAQILRLLQQLQAQHGSAIIFITHDLGVIAQLAHQVVVMYLGKVMERGPVDAIFHAPRHPYTRALLKSMPSLDAPARQALPTIRGSIPHPFNRPPGCPFHNRCSEAMPGRCDVDTPALYGADGEQPVSCFLFHDKVEAPETWAQGTTAKKRREGARA